MILQTGSYLKSDEVKTGDIVTVKDSGSIQISEKFKTKLPDGTEIPKKQYVFKVEYKGVEKNLNMNKMSRDNLSVAYTNNTETWVGKKASIELCLFPNGKRGIVLSPIVEVATHEEETVNPDADGPEPF
jgi:hypothetical protein